MKNAGWGEKERSKPVYMVEADEDDDISFLADLTFGCWTVQVYGTGCRERLRTESAGKMVLDTACAKTVCGWLWMVTHIQILAKLGIKYESLVVQEREPFRFGPGERIWSLFSMWLPIVVDGEVIFWLRTAVVSEDVPLLVSKPALKALGGVVDLDENVIEFKRIYARMHTSATPPPGTL